MHLYLLTSEYPPFFGGGIGTYAHHVAKMMTRNGQRVTVLVRDGKRDCVEMLNENLRIVRFKHNGGPYAGEGYWMGLSRQFCDQVVRLIRHDGEKPDLIEFQEYGAIGWVLLQERWTGHHLLKDVPMLVHLHTPAIMIEALNKGPVYQFPIYWTGELEKFSINAADGIVCPSRYLADRVRPLIYRTQRNTDVLPYPFELEPTARASSCRYDAAYVGRMELRKGVVPFLEAVERLWRSGTEFTVCMIGGDTWYADRNVSMTAYLKTCYSHRIREGLLTFVPNTPPGELLKMVEQARIAVVPSLFENFPYTAIEAMHLARPMLVSSSGGQAEMVGDDESCGLVFDWQRAGHFEVQFRRLLEADPASLADMGRCAEKRIRRQTNYSDNYVRRCDLYERIIAAAHPGHFFPVEKPGCLLAASSASTLNDDIREPAEGRESGVFPAISRTGNGETEENGTGDSLSIIVLFSDIAQRLDKTLAHLEMLECPHEVWIVNSAMNTPGSMERLSLFSRDRPRRHVIGDADPGHARWTGAVNASGTFLAFMPAGGWVVPEFYTRAIALLKRYSNVGFVYSWLQYEGTRRSSRLTYNTALPFLLMADMTGPIKVLRKTDFLRYGMQEEGGAPEDAPCLRMVLEGYSGIAIPEFLSYLHPAEGNREEERIPPRLNAREHLSERYSSVYRHYGVEIFNLLNANGPGHYWQEPAKGNIFNTVSQEPFFILNSMIVRHYDRYDRLKRLLPHWALRFAKKALKILDGE